MNTEEIIAVKEKVLKDSLSEVDTVIEDDAIADMGETEGWKIMLKKVNRRIAGLLEPIPKKELNTSTDLALLGAIAVARSEAIEELRWIVEEVESIKKARKLLRKQEESKPVAQ